MKRKTVRFIIATILMASLLPVVPQTVLAEDITISTPAELEAFRDSVNGGTDYSGVTVTLAADIDLDGRWDKQWTPIGTNCNTPFAGTFDGGGHKITGLYINRPNEGHQGLFGVNIGTIQNLSVEGQVAGFNYVGGVVGKNGSKLVRGQELIDCHYAGSVNGDKYVGGVAGYNWDSVVSGCSNEGAVAGGHFIGGVIGSGKFSLITNCYNTGFVTGNLDIDRDGAIGGVLGHTYMTDVIDCYNKGIVVGTHEVGGVVGERNLLEMTGCYNSGAISGGDNVGGVIGKSWSYNVANCYNFGTVSGDKNVGGVTGYNDATLELTSCYNTGEVYGKENVGGVTGLNQKSVIMNCYNTGKLTGDSYVGGIIGNNNIGGKVISCYNIGYVNDGGCGGVFGYTRRYNDIINCCYLVDAASTEGYVVNEEITKFTAIDKAAFAAHTTFQDWDFTNTWIMSAALGRPVLRAIPENGSGTEKDCFVDVLQDMWYYEPVQYVFQHGLMTGVSGTKFAPEETVTRGMFVTVLYRMENEPEPVQKYAFTDVSPDAYYAGATAWASEHGIVLGSEVRKFSPEETITREQMAAILYRYAHYKGCDIEVNGIVSCIDSDRISTYALEAVTWLVNKKMMQGNESGAFLPDVYATRAEAAAVFQKMIQYLI